jgi:type II secretory pathway component GspD/PulD (secretin)
MTVVYRFAAACLVAGWLSCLALMPVSAADSDAPFVGILALANDAAVAKELGLSDEIKKQLSDLISKRVDEGTPLGLDIKDLSADEQKAKLAPFVAESEKQGLALLTNEQKAKLQQIRVRQLGMKGLLDNAIAQQVGLPEKLRERISNAFAFNEMQTAGKPEAERKAAKIKVEKDILAMLDNDQRAKWEALSGQGLAVAQAEDAGEKPMNDKPEASQPETDKPATDKTTTPAARTIVNSKTGNTTVKPPLKAGDPNVKLKFQFSHAPWKEVIEWFAEQADLALVTDVFPQGTFNFVEPNRTYTPAQSIDLLNSVLILKGYRMVRKEKMLFLLSAEDELPPEFYRRVTESELDKLGEFEIVQCQFQLSKITAEEAEVEVRKLISTQGKVVILPKAKQIVVTEMAGALKLVHNALKAIENPETPKDVTEVKLENLRPSEFMVLARPLLGMLDNQNATPDGGLRIAMDELGMRLLVTGKPENVERLLQLQKVVDTSSVPGEPGAIAEQPQLIIYSVDNADPLSVLQILQTLLAGKQDVRLTIDPKSGNLVAYCYPSNHKTIKAVLDDMQRDATQYKTFKLRKNDPQSITLQINELFGGSADKPSPNAPKVVADTTNLQILVRASPAQLTKIQELLKEMGELGGTVTAENTIRSNTRVLQGTGKTIEAILSQMEYTWPAAGNENKIKVHRIQRNVPNQLRDNMTPEERQLREEFGIPEERTAPGRVGPIPAPAPNAPANESTTKATDKTSRVIAPPPAPAKAPPVPAAPAPSDPNRSSTKSYRFQFISHQAPAEESKEEPTAEEPAPPVGPKSKPGADIVISIGQGTIVIASEDLDALDRFEAELRLLIEAAGGSNTKEMHYIPLKHAKAQVAATLVTEIISGAPAPSEGGGGGSLMGDLASSMMGDMFGGLLGGMGGGAGSGSTTTSGGLSITPDIRNNALFVNCTQRDLMRIEDILTYIDTPSPPEGYSPNPSPRFILVENTTAESVATVVRSVYAGRLTADAAGGQQRQPNPEDFIRALRGGRGGANQQQNKGEEQKMTVGVDSRTNSLVVIAPDYLFEEVKALVKVLDVAELPSDTVVRVKSLRSANADVLSRSLGQLYGDSITISKTSNTGTTTTRTGAGPGGQPRPGANQQRQGGSQQRNGQNSNNNNQPQEPNVNAQMQQLMNAMQGGRGSRGGGDSRGGGGFGGGGFGGGRGGR